MIVTHRVERGVATVTLNRPAQFNALSSALLQALHMALQAAGADPTVRVIVLAANGRAFCAGHDLREMRAHPGKDWQLALFQRCSELMLLIDALPQPVIARVQGLATAAGCQLVAACDLAIAARSAQFATSGVNLGLFCSTPAVAVTRAVGDKRAAELLLSGRFIDAATAERWGLISRAVDDAALDAEIDAMAQAIAQKSAHAIRSGKALLRSIRAKSPHDAYAIAAENMACDMQTEDAQLGIDTFLQQRQRNKPVDIGEN